MRCATARSTTDRKFSLPSHIAARGNTRRRLSAKPFARPLVASKATHDSAHRGSFSGPPNGALALTIHRDPVDSAAPWRAPAAYLYTLDLDGPALAWEYLRRHPGYRADWARGAFRRRQVVAPRWGLRCWRRPAPRCARRAASVDRRHRGSAACARHVRARCTSPADLQPLAHSRPQAPCACGLGVGHGSRHRVAGPADLAVH
nr:DUF6499 domain-containing protein [Variovorax sp. SRS16]